jgi:hypothetical protein
MRSAVGVFVGILQYLGMYPAVHESSFLCTGIIWLVMARCVLVSLFSPFIQPFEKVLERSLGCNRLKTFWSVALSFFVGKSLNMWPCLLHPKHLVGPLFPLASASACSAMDRHVMHATVYLFPALYVGTTFCVLFCIIVCDRELVPRPCCLYLNGFLNSASWNAPMKALPGVGVLVAAGDCGWRSFLPRYSPPV